MERKSPLPRETISQPPRKDTILVNQKTAHVSSDGPLYWLLHQYGINFPKCSADLSLSRYSIAEEKETFDLFLNTALRYNETHSPLLSSHKKNPPKFGKLEEAERSVQIG